MTDIACAACLAPLIPRLRAAHWHCDACDAATCPVCGAAIDDDDFLCDDCRQLVDGMRERERLQKNRQKACRFSGGMNAVYRLTR